MTDKTLNRRTFFSAVAAATAMHTNPLLALSPGVQEGAEAFLKDWVAAWNRRDAHSLASLHTDDAMTINRYGTLIRGRASSQLLIASGRQIAVSEVPGRPASAHGSWNGSLSSTPACLHRR